MDEETIELEAGSLEEARRQVPAGCRLANEEIRSDGRPQPIQGTAETVEAAFQQARATLPAEVEVLARREVVSPGQKSLEIAAFDEVEARSLAQRRLDAGGKILDLRLDRLGRKGFLGIGRQPNSYAVTVTQPARVEITFKTKARIRGKLHKLPSASELAASAARLRDELLAMGTKLRDAPELQRMNAIMALQVLMFGFNWLKSALCDPFNLLLEDAQTLWPEDRAVQALQRVALSHPNTFCPEDSPIFWRQFGEAQAALDKLISLVSARCGMSEVGPRPTAG